MRLLVEIEGLANCPPLPGDGGLLAAFMSFCVARGFGAEHPLLTIAERLDLDHGVRIGPFTHFYEADAEDSEDTEKLELAWQEPARLAESAAKAAIALRDDPRLRELAAKAGEGDLPAQMAALAAEAGRAQEAGARVRLTFTL